MENKSAYVHLGEGVLRSFVMTLICILIYSVVLRFATITENVTSIFILVLTLLSVVFGAIYSARKINKRGWLIGLIVACLYMVILYLVSLLAGRDGALTSAHFIKFGLAAVVGALSGMLGINL